MLCLMDYVMELINIVSSASEWNDGDKKNYKNS